MSVEEFLDTNVLLYMFDETDPDKRRLARSLVYRSLEKGSGCISYQVVQETMNVVTRKLGATPEAARRLLDDVLVPLWRISPTADLYRRALSLQSQYRFSFYDSLVAAAALEAGCARLYTEDLQDGQLVHGLTIRNPFA